MRYKLYDEKMKSFKNLTFCYLLILTSEFLHKRGYVEAHVISFQQLLSLHVYNTLNMCKICIKILLKI